MDRDLRVDAYIAGSPPAVRRRLRRIRATIRAAAPDAVETISYQMPAFTLHGVPVYIAAFTHHIGLYPPVRDDAALAKALAPYAGPKGNLKFPHDAAIPYDLITRIVTLRARQNRAKATARGVTKREPARSTTCHGKGHAPAGQAKLRADRPPE